MPYEPPTKRRWPGRSDYGSLNLPTGYQADAVGSIAPWISRRMMALQHGGLGVTSAPPGEPHRTVVVIGDRPDLLAEEAGIQLGSHESDLDEPRARAMAVLLIAAAPTSP